MHEAVTRYWRGLVLAGMAFGSTPALAGRPVFEIDIRDHLFWPADIRVPANTRIKLKVNNRDPSPEEFESYELNREKVILGRRSAVIFIGPLLPGEYRFFGEFNPDTAQGRLVAK